jgi:hypothetical protein
LRNNEAAQLNRSLVGFDTDLEGLKKIISGKQRFDLGRNHRIVNVFSCAFLSACRCTRRKGNYQHNMHVAQLSVLSFFPQLRCDQDLIEGHRKFFAKNLENCKIWILYIKDKGLLWINEDHKEGES